MKKLFALVMMPIIIWIEINVSSEKCKGMYLEIFLMQLSSLIVEGLKHMHRCSCDLLCSLQT